MDAASKLDPSVALSRVNSGDLVIATTIPSKRGVVIAKIITYSPMSEEEFRRFASRIEQSTASERLDFKASNPFTFKATAERLNATSPKGKKITADAKPDAAPNGVETEVEGM